AATRLLRRGPSLARLLGVVFLAGLCAVTKTTVLIALPLALVAVALSAGARRWLTPVLVLLMVAMGVAALSVLDWGDALTWYRLTNQPVATQAVRPEAPWGTHALRLLARPGRPPGQVRQFLLAGATAAVAGQPATVGAWIWASSSGPAYLPQVGDSPPVSVTVGTSPAFFSASVTVPAGAQRLAVSLAASPAEGETADRAIYYDGLVLAEGDWPGANPPVFGQANSQTGTWAGRPFTNRLRNASAEQGGPWVRPWAESLFQRVAGAYLSPAALVGALADYERNGPLYGLTTSRLFESFWARFGWAQITLPPAGYWLAIGFTVLGAAGGIFRVARGRGREPRSWKLAVAWLGLAMLVSWSTVYLRGLFTVIDGSVVLPVARYAYPVVIPTLLLLVAGWQQVFGARWTRANPRAWLALAPWAFFLAVDIGSVLAILDYYRQV
ncbi:MAG: hypothetical protein ABI847_14000, partial [Anaerolineales bacterium]